MALQIIYLLIETMKAYFTTYLRAFSYTTYYHKYLTIFFLNLKLMVSLFRQPENKRAEYFPFLGEFIVGPVSNSY